MIDTDFPLEPGVSALSLDPQAAAALEAVRQAAAMDEALAVEALPAIQQALDQADAARLQCEQAHEALRVLRQDPSADRAALAEARQHYEQSLQQARALWQSAAAAARAAHQALRTEQLGQIELADETDEAEVAESGELMSEAAWRQGLEAEGIVLNPSGGHYRPLWLMRLQDVRLYLINALQPGLSRMAQTQRLALLQAALRSVPRASATLARLARQATARLQQLAKPVPGNVHFLWLGALPATLKASLRLFLARQQAADAVPLRFYLASDERALMAPRLNQLLKKLALASINGLPADSERTALFRQRWLQLQNQAYEALLPRLMPSGSDPSQVVIDFMVEVHGQPRAELQAWLAAARQEWASVEQIFAERFGAGSLQRVDLASLLPAEHALYPIYLQELWLRGNLPAAADLGRSLLLNQYGGSYLDADVSLRPRAEVFSGRTLPTLERELLARVARHSSPDTLTGNLAVFSTQLHAIRVQATHNHLAQWPGDPFGVAALAGDQAYQALRDNLMVQFVPEIAELAQRYLQEVQGAPARRLQGIGQELSQVLPALFEPIPRATVGAVGLAMQRRPRLTIGFDIDVMHARAGAPAFAHYWQLVQQRYRELSERQLLWYPDLPQALPEDADYRERAHGLYRLDGMEVDSGVTGYLTGPNAFARAILQALAPDEPQDDSDDSAQSDTSGDSAASEISDEEEGSAVREADAMPWMAWRDWQQLTAEDALPLYAAPAWLASDTPADIESSWRGAPLPARLSLSEASKYARQLVLSLDQRELTQTAARYLNNRHPNSRHIVRQGDGALRLDNRLVQQLDASQWDDNSRLVLVGQLSADQRELGDLPAAALARLIAQLLPPGGQIARIKLVANASLPLAPGRGPDYVENLLRALRAEGVDGATVKSYGSELVVDVFGQVWQSDMPGGESWQRGGGLRYLARLEGEQFVRVPVPEAGVPGLARYQPPYAVALPGEAVSRRAVLLVVPQEVLQRAGGTLFHQAVYSLRHKHPETEFYALSEQDGVWRQWVMRPVGEGSGRDGWVRLAEPLRGRFAKLTVLGHGEGDLGLVSAMRQPDLPAQLAGMLSEVRAIGHLALLACQSEPETGALLYHALRQAHPELSLSRLSGSEQQVYLVRRGGPLQGTIQPGRHVYRVGNQLQHGGHVGKWQLTPQPDGSLQVARHVPSPYPRATTVVNDGGHGVVGPFDLWQQQAEARAAQVQVEDWLGTQERILSAVYEAQGLSRREWLAVPDSLQRLADGGYRLSLVHRQRGEVRQVMLAEGAALARAQASLRDLWRQLASQVEVGPAGSPLRLKPAVEGEAGGLNSMNSAFLIMALMSWLSGRALSTEARLSAYWNLAAMGTAVAGDGVQFGRLVLELAAPESAALSSLALLARAFETGNMLFMAGSVVWDGWRFFHAPDPVSRAAAGTQFGFSSAALLLQLGSGVLTRLLPEAALAGPFGLLALPLAAAGFGFSALAGQIAAHQQQSHGLLDYLSKARDGYRRGGFLRDEESGAMVADPYVVIEQLDFLNGQLTFGSQQMVKSGYDDALSRPSRRHGQHFALREAFGVPRQLALPDSDAEWVLPSTPALWLDYQYTAGRVSLSEREQQVVTLLEQAGVFAFARGIYSAGALTLRRQALSLSVILARGAQTLWFSRGSGEMAYRLQGQGGSYRLMGLHAGVRLQLSEAQPSHFELSLPDARLATPESVQLQDGQLLLHDDQGGVLTVGMHGLRGSLQVAGSIGRWQIDLLSGVVRLQALDLRSGSPVPAREQWQQWQRQRRVAPLVRLIHGQLPAPLPASASAAARAVWRRQWSEQQSYCREQWYDSRQGRLLSNGIDDVGRLAIGLRCVGVTAEHAYYFNPLQLAFWRSARDSDRFDGRIPLCFGGEQSLIESVVAAGAHCLVSQRIEGEGRPALGLRYVLQDGQMVLHSVQGLEERPLHAWLAGWRSPVAGENLLAPWQSLLTGAAPGRGVQLTSPQVIETVLAPWLLMETSTARRLVCLPAQGCWQVLEAGIADQVPVHVWHTPAGARLLCWSASSGQLWLSEALQAGVPGGALSCLPLRGVRAVQSRGTALWLTCADGALRMLTLTDGGQPRWSEMIRPETA
ncbi:TcdA/TcdB pore-forming domain-containing protein [Paludibacterium sp. B53371]|uniref:TcdA/TcdB pore-forming domain-containing protein n=1 Tax=Paludibacterium sp. B53371 TaxID=2806263 RepID=UPI001C044604|nr:TcdA/TcdB pore-forming domain-containing protein [Paludibacterium sp. B53371]